MQAALADRESTNRAEREERRALPAFRGWRVVPDALRRRRGNSLSISAGESDSSVCSNANLQQIEMYYFCSQLAPSETRADKGAQRTSFGLDAGQFVSLLISRRLDFKVIAHLHLVYPLLFAVRLWCRCSSRLPADEMRMFYCDQLSTEPNINLSFVSGGNVTDCTTCATVHPGERRILHHQTRNAANANGTEVWKTLCRWFECKVHSLLNA